MPSTLRRLFALTSFTTGPGFLTRHRQTPGPDRSAPESLRASGETGKGIDFEVPNIVNPSFEVTPHLDVQISFAEGTWKRAGIEAKLAQVDAILALKEK
jgi:hypothetical protein